MEIGVCTYIYIVDMYLVGMKAKTTITIDSEVLKKAKEMITKGLGKKDESNNNVGNGANLKS